MDTIRVRKCDVRAVLAASFPGYTGRKFRVQVCTHVSLSDLHWSGGTRSEYVAVELSSGRRSPARTGTPWNGAEGARVEIPAGAVVVEHARFMGEDAGITVHVRPENAPRLLPAGAEVSVSRDTCSPNGRPLARAGMHAVLRGACSVREGDELAVVDLDTGADAPFRTVVPFDALTVQS